MCICITFAFSTTAQESGNASGLNTVMEELDPLLDYHIGSNRGVTNRRMRPTVDINAPEFGWNVGASCSGWDASISVSGMMNDAKSKFGKLYRDVVSSVTGFIINYPMLLIQREDPGLYEMLNHSILSGEDIFDVSAAHCRDMSKRYMDSSDGLGELLDASAWMEFAKKEEDGKEDLDLVEEVDSADENKGEAGVVEMGGEMCGAFGIKMCTPVIDVIQEGYARNSSGGTQSNSGEPMIGWVEQIWASARDAQDWIVSVVGDVKYATCQECTKLSEIPGYGVYGYIADEASTVRELLIQIVESDATPSIDDLKSVSSNDVLIGEGVIMALRDETVMRGLFVDRVSQDVALLRVVDQLLAARRILIAGRGDANFSSVPKNNEIIDAKINMVSDEVMMIKEELELKRVARGDAVATLLGRYETRKAIRSGEDSGSGVSEYRFTQGLKESGRG
ncbi:integrating conjugative element protein [Alteromonas sp. KUL42]|uniref:hypothetical protein n=1 Tax=Alteromonas sp. KUL42 TaxID=2480797 RepID=UPI0010356D21|nr:hypothetical protein [Alteromonas sp. KUL42]TAP31713.1 hypothetical protein EYR97_19690 [Alteromonas sp. KUL42]GEA09146.1 integrating conjugative element protein [Alteromonas sp. KUL42]